MPAARTSRTTASRARRAPCSRDMPDQLVVSQRLHTETDRFTPASPAGEQPRVDGLWIGERDLGDISQRRHTTAGTHNASHIVGRQERGAPPPKLVSAGPGVSAWRDRAISVTSASST